VRDRRQGALITNVAARLSSTTIVLLRMAPKTFADRPINKLVLFDVDGTLTPARQVEISSTWLPLSRR